MLTRNMIPLLCRISQRQFSSTTAGTGKRVLVAIANGSEEIELSAIVDVLRRSETHVTIAKVDKNETGSNDKLSTLMHGMKVEADEVFDASSSHDYDAIVMPGGLPGS